eukprot:Pgem_evm1s19541
MEHQEESAPLLQNTPREVVDDFSQDSDSCDKDDSSSGRSEDVKSAESDVLVMQQESWWQRSSKLILSLICLAIICFIWIYSGEIGQ